MTVSHESSSFNITSHTSVTHCIDSKYMKVEWSYKYISPRTCPYRRSNWSTSSHSRLYITCSWQKLVANTIPFITSSSKFLECTPTIIKLTCFFFYYRITQKITLARKKKTLEYKQRKRRFGSRHGAKETARVLCVQLAVCCCISNVVYRTYVQSLPWEPARHDERSGPTPSLTYNLSHSLRLPYSWQGYIPIYTVMRDI